MAGETLNKVTVLVMAGGTGGHVFPALAVANELRSRGVNVQWLGTRRGLEAEVVPRAGYAISFINVAGLRGNGLMGWILAPFKLLYALSQGLSVMRRLKPAVVLGMGGFVTGPGGVAAWLARIPLLIHEQNAISGMTNRLLAPLATTVMEAFPGSIAKGKAIHTGNPVRSEITALFESYGTSAGEKSSAPGIGGLHMKVLVVGGSLGAAALNEVVPQALAQLAPDQRPEVWHQTGKKHLDTALKHYQGAGVQANVVPFIDDMAQAYQWADLVICRAGAMTVAELAVAGLPSILVPYPFAVDDHQTSNAQYLSKSNAAVLIQQRELNVQILKQLLEDLRGERLGDMSRKTRALALPNATKDVADYCLKAIKI